LDIPSIENIDETESLSICTGERINIDNTKTIKIDKKSAGMILLILLLKKNKIQFLL
jgi:hypothetical protein